jgi:hypothetical protein
MHTFCIQTLVDIGNPGDTRRTFPFTSSTGVLVDDRDTLDLVRAQHNNFVTTQQLLQMRSNINWTDIPARSSQKLTDGSFGSFYREGSHNVWLFAWHVEQNDVYNIDSDPVAGLIEDFDLVPVNAFCQETVTFPANCFNTTDPRFKNTVFMDLGPEDK